MYDLGLDLGFGNVKIYEQRGSTILASHIASPSVQYAPDDGKQGKEVTQVAFAGARYVVGQYVAWHGTEIAGLGMSRLLGSMEVKAIAYATLGTHFSEYSKPKSGLNVYVGLPAELLTVENKQATTDAVRGWLLGRHEWQHDGKEQWIVIDDVSVFSQAAGAMFDMLYTRDGIQTRDATYANDDIGVISIGYNTVELSGVLAGKPSNLMKASEPYGVRRMLESLSNKTGYRLSELDALLRDGRLNGDLPSASQAWADRVVGFVDTTWGKSANRLKRVIVVGGGCKYAYPALSAVFGQRLWVPENHIVAIARGLYKRAVVNGKKE